MPLIFLSLVLLEGIKFVGGGGQNDRPKSRPLNIVSYKKCSPSMDKF